MPKKKKSNPNKRGYLARANSFMAADAEQAAQPKSTGLHTNIPEPPVHQLRTAGRKWGVRTRNAALVAAPVGLGAWGLSRYKAKQPPVEPASKRLDNVVVDYMTEMDGYLRDQRVMGWRTR